MQESQWICCLQIKKYLNLSASNCLKWSEINSDTFTNVILIYIDVINRHSLQKHAILWVIHEAVDLGLGWPSKCFWGGGDSGAYFSCE